MSTQHEKLINTFYTAFANQDIEGMLACYHPDIEFTDSAFVGLKGEEACSMWKMLLSRSSDDFKLTFKDIKSDGQKGSAYWEPHYTFSQTGRFVINKIYASFEFKDDKIIKHTDYFNFWHWSRQALGLPGWLLGWTPFFQKTVQKRARKSLDIFMQKNKTK